MKRVAAVVLVALAVAGCGEKKERVNPSTGHAQSLTLMLDWLPNADHVGIYQALAEGDFARAALNVNVQAPGNPALPLELHYLLTTWAETAQKQQRLLGWCMTALGESPLLLSAQNAASWSAAARKGLAKDD